MNSRKISLLSFALLLASLSLGAQQITLTLSNTVNESLGAVTLANASEQTFLNVTSSGIFTTSMNAEPTSITIAGQTVLRPSPGPIMLPSGTMIDVRWNSGYVVLQNIKEEDLRR